MNSIYTILILPRVLIIDFFQPFWLEQMGNIGSIAQSTKSWCQLGISSLYMYFLFTICSATRISWQNERIDVAPNTTNYYCTTSNGAHSKNEHHWEQFDGEGKKISGGIGGRKSAPVLDIVALYIASCKFHIRVCILVVQF